ncbi:hypothetical protein BDW59DRAFT_179077 [Aspergillus cavernicola]|uniref:Transcription activator of gluconeogenesis acuK n=1 Tax=Aspergillus cavernicola TaxID=176166 RepID=A0ABR4IJ10_9EURO
MQSLALPPSFVAPEFGRLQFAGPERHSLNLSRSANARRRTPRDLPLPCSMSSSVKAEGPLETLENLRRSGHPDLSQPVTTTAVTTVGATAASAAILSPVSPETVTAYEPTFQRLVTAPGDKPSRQPLAFSEPFPSSRLPHSLTGQASSQPLTATYAQPTFGASPAGPASRALPQKTTRRTKAHVASACVNCKKKHLGCDQARPCRRCVLSNKEATCVDVTHKKRGRPPLKAEEGSIRTYTTQMDSRGAPGDHGSQPRRSMHRATSSRELRPMTDLQMHGAQAGAMGVRLAPGQPQRWSTVVYPHGIDPSLATQRSTGHRRFSSSGSAQSLTAVSPTGYGPMPAGYNPALAAGRMPAGVGRPIPTYPNQGVHSIASPPQYHQPYSVPISPYTEGTRMAGRMQMSEGSALRDPREGFVESPVRLPPIYPSPVTNPQSHRPSDQYSTGWSPTQQQQHQPGFAEPISPSNQMRQTAPDFGYMSQPVVVSSIEGQPQQLPSTRTHYEQRGPESEDGDSLRPAKRRKMALDDMVND